MQKIIDSLPLFIITPLFIGKISCVYPDIILKISFEFSSFFIDLFGAGKFSDIVPASFSIVPRMNEYV